MFEMGGVGGALGNTIIQNWLLLLFAACVWLSDSHITIPFYNAHHSLTQCHSLLRISHFTHRKPLELLEENKGQKGKNISSSSPSI